MSNLPQDFTEKMKKLLGKDFDGFIQGYSLERQYGMRRNPLKISRDEFEKMEFVMQRVEWAAEGYYYNNEMRPGRHPYHEAGLYYIQEPSAMSVAELLEVEPGDRVLDLCAAPGGKSTQLAGKMMGRGLLVSNEINPARAKVLSQNIERMGIRNAVVLNEDSSRLAEKFPSFFDKILVDAPCSGEGMFRKDENAATEWSLSQVEVCAERQQMILENAAIMLKPGGTLVYSTCTFSPEENEGVINAFVKQHPEYEILECEHYEGFDHGHSEWVEAPVEGIERTIRLWPHRLGGEGHFAARLIKHSGDEKNYSAYSHFDKKMDVNEYKKFSSEYLKMDIDKDTLITFGDQLYSIPCEMIPLKGIKVVRPGLHLGTNKKNRFEPAHALALSMNTNEAKNVRNMSVEEAKGYLSGQTVDDEVHKGWTLMTIDGYSVGWGKCSGGVVKNHYPKGLRMNWQ